MSRPLNVSVVIAAKNESRNIEWVLRRIPSTVHEVILVDGLSRDRTIEIAQMIKPDLVVVHEDRPGKGRALRSGFDAASGDVIVMLDADCSMDPLEIEPMVSALAEGYDVVKGSRFMAGGGSSDITWFRKTGNRALLALTNLLYSTSFSELCYGYMGFHRDVIAGLDLSADGFDIEAQIVTRATRARLSIREVPSFESPRRHGASNLNAIRDGFRILRVLLRERIRRRAPSRGSAEGLAARERRGVN